MILCAARQSAIAVRAADEELSRGVDVPHRIAIDPVPRQRTCHIGLDHRPDIARTQVFIGVLVRHHDLGGLDGFAVLVTYRHLALRIRAKPLFFTGPPCFRKAVKNTVGVINRGRHQLRRFSAGVTEHDALIAGTLVLVVDGVDPDRDIGRLGVQQHLDFGGLPVEALLLIADVLDGGTRRLLDGRGFDSRSTNLPRDHHPIRRSEGLAGDPDLVGVEPRLGTLSEEQVDDLIRDAITNLVGVTFGHGLAGEKKVGPDHVAPPFIERVRRQRNAAALTGARKCYDGGVLRAARSFRQALWGQNVR